MTDEALTFSELRKIEKKEKRQEDLADLDDNFFLRVSQYLEMKKSTDDREYRNAKRVFNKIIGLRQQKIVKNAKISVKTDVKASELNFLPREAELFRNVKEVFEEYSEDVESVVNGEEDNLESGADGQDSEAEDEGEQEEQQKNTEESEDDMEVYEQVKIVSDVPEFMGTDLESYGPFDEGEEVEIPEENAEILVNRGNAEVIE